MQPDNLLIDAKGLLLITDFGLSHDGLHTRTAPILTSDHASTSTSFMAGAPDRFQPVIIPGAEEAALDATGVPRSKTPPNIGKLHPAGGPLAMLSSGWKALQGQLGVTDKTEKGTTIDDGRVRLFSGVGKWCRLPNVTALVCC